MQILVYLRDFVTVRITLFLPLEYTDGRAAGLSWFSSLYHSVSQCLMMIQHHNLSHTYIKVGSVEEASCPEGFFSNIGHASSYSCVTNR